MTWVMCPNRGWHKQRHTVELHDRHCVNQGLITLCTKLPT